MHRKHEAEQADGAFESTETSAAPVSEQTRDRIDEIILGGPRQYTRLQVAELSGVPPESTQRRWRSLGFAAVDDDSVRFTDADIEAAKLSEGLLATGIVPKGMDVAVSRALGHHLSRLAEWQTELVRELLAERPDLVGDEQQLVAFVDGVVPLIERIQNFVWRRHLAAYAGRAFGAQDDDSGQRAVGFVDMVGYTRLTRQIDEEQLSVVLEKFEAAAAGAVADRSGRIVKMIGDEVLFVADTPLEAAEIAIELNRRAEADGDIPELRTGMAFGDVLSRLGDVYGKVVNVAARLTSTARPGTIVVDEELAQALGDDSPYSLRSLRPVSVRGYSKLRRYALKRPSE